MAWVAVFPDSSEFVSDCKPRRVIEEHPVFDLYTCGTKVELEENWEFHRDASVVQLPQGSIKKLIGRDLTWEDNPVELKYF